MMMKKTKKRVEKIEVTQAPDPSELTDEELDEVSGGLGECGGGFIGPRGMGDPTLRNPATDTTIQTVIPAGTVGNRGMIKK